MVIIQYRRFGSAENSGGMELDGVKLATEVN